MLRNDPESLRLSGDRESLATWRRWGPYVADRAWGTVREDYSPNGDAWSYFPHDHARSRTYRWGEDGIAGFCDRYQILAWSLGLWNERDPILKERYFGLVPSESNHGEDLKEYYFYLDAVPSHSYMRMLYKYPQREFPYQHLIDANRGRSDQPEVELLDTGIFDDDRYFDIEIEIAKNTCDEIHFKITAHNRGPEPAPLHLIPQLCFRNVWSWGGKPRSWPRISEAIIEGGMAMLADDSQAPPLEGLMADTRLGPMRFDIEGSPELLFTDNETNAARVWGPHARSLSPFTKDAFHRRIVGNDESATNPSRIGTKACAWQRFVVPAQGSVSMRMVLGAADAPADASRVARTDDVVAIRRLEADAFYETIHPEKATVEDRRVQRQAFAGLLWSKQIYLYDVATWIDGDNPAFAPPESRKHGRNRHWRHLNSMRILSMPDKWEYPWFAAWDLAFHAVTIAIVDQELAKEQLWLMLFEQFQHPNGQIAAYEWEFSDLNPPVLPWAVWRVYNMDRIRNGKGDRVFLETCFHKLLLNFTWWVNKVDREGNNVFEGGFLGLDNITVVDRSDPLANGAVLEQSDATGWMGMFSLVMMRIALELARTNPTYEGLATKFFEHYVYIGAAMNMERNGRTLWDKEDGFFYDLLRFPDGHAIPFRVRSMVGLIPLYAIERLEERWIEPFENFRANLDWFLVNRSEIVNHCVSTVNGPEGKTLVLAVVDQDELVRLLACVVDPAEFLSTHGLRSLSKAHEKAPFVFGDSSVGYEPGESRSKLKGGNSNWRGPIWFPTSFLMIESLRKLEKAFGSDFEIALNAGDERSKVTLSGLAANLAERLIGIFLPSPDGYRPLYGPPGTRKAERFAHDPHWKDLILYHEYFHGDSGEGLGASHQTGWTALVASLIDEWRK